MKLSWSKCLFTQSSRRITVVLFFVSYALIGIATLFEGNPTWDFLGGFGLGFSPFCLIALLYWALPLTRENKIDERQRVRRNEMYMLAYRVIVFTVVIVWFVVAVLLSIDPSYFSHLTAQPSELVKLSAFTVIPFVGFLPIAMLMWLEPDPIQDDFTTGELA